MFNIKNKFKGHSSWKEILIALISSIIFNLSIFFIGWVISYNYFVMSGFTSIYYGALVGFLAIYATVIAISTNLSQEFPLKISLKYIVNSRLSLSYLFILGTNTLFVHALFLNSISGNFEQIILVLSTVILFLLTIIFVLLFMNQFKLEIHLKSFFEDMINRYSGDFIIPKVSNTKGYGVTEKEGFFVITSKIFLREKEKVDSEGIEAKNISNENLFSNPTLKQKISPKILPVYIGKGKLQVKKWDFLNQINFPINLRINKYEFGDDTLSFQVICEYYLSDREKDIETELKKILQENISYKDFPKEEFKDVFDKLSKNGTEEKLIEMIKKYIAKQGNLLERRFLFSSFEKYFKETALNKTALSTEELLGIEISSLYEQKELFFKSPAIVAKLQDRLTIILIRAFRKIDYLNPRLNTSGLYTKEFLDIRYIDSFKKSQDLNWIQEYDYLITNTTKNLFLLCKSIIELDIKNELKKKYLIEQIGHLNRVLEHYEHLHEIDFLREYYDRNIDISKRELADKKISIVKKQQEYLKEKQSELFYLILYNIDKEELHKDFFEVALKIYNLTGFDKQYYKYERFDKLDWLNYDWFRGGVQAIASFNFSKYRLLISFYKYLNTEEIDIKQFEKENFTDTSHPFEKELDNLTEDFISKYFDYDKKKVAQFKEQILKDIKDKKESITKDEKDYIIKTPLKEEYVNKFIKDCKEAWKTKQKDVSRFMLLKEVKGGYKIKTFFGQYTLFDKKWFLDSFDKNVGLSRESGEEFGQSQGNSKIKHILDLITKSFDKTKDKEIIIKDITSDLSKEIRPDKEYYLFYGLDFGIYEIPNLNWNRQGIETANLVLNNSTIRLCHSYNQENLLFEKGAFILEQYKQGYEKINEPLVVQIEIINKDEEIKNILEKNKNFKSEEDVKQMVKIRIAEKFNVKRNKNTRLIRLKI